MQQVERLRRWILRLGVLLAATLSGCGVFIIPRGGGDYGIEPPERNPDPKLRIVDLTYTPASPVALGTEIVFTATLNHPSTAADMISVYIGEGLSLMPPESSFAPVAPLFDNGQAPDATANDGIYTGVLTLPVSIGARTNLPVMARVVWWSTATPPSFAGEPLDTVIPEG